MFPTSEGRYAEDGVDVESEALFSKFAGGVCKESYRNSPFVEVHDLSQGNFRGPRPFSFKNLPEGYLVEASADGLGSKGILIDAAGAHETAAYDLIAMTASDITRYGGLPLVLINILDLLAVGDPESNTHATYKKLLIGLGTAARESNTVVLKGETAQMGVSISSEIRDSQTHFNWGATMIGVYAKDRVITGDGLKAGQVVVALREHGFRCNGISSVRKALRMKYGEEWWKNADAQADIQAAAVPSILYDKFVNTLVGWYDPLFTPEIRLHAIVHLSGGGIKEKFGRDILFKYGFSATLDSLWEPPDIMRKCAEWRGIEDEEFYGVWNGGQGMLLVVDREDAEHCIKRAHDFGIEARACGAVTEEDAPILRIESQLHQVEVLYEAG